MNFDRKLATAAVVSLLALTGCAAQAPTAPTSPSVSPINELTATTTVLDRGDEHGVILCLGLIGQSYPPTCAGPAVEGWDWAAIDGEKTATGVTWGDFEVVGTWDGEALTLTQPPTVKDDSDEVMQPNRTLPPADPDKAPKVDQALTDYIAASEASSGVLTVGEDAGRLHVNVVFDDGSLQEKADELYGADVVVIDSALRPI
jgi:hypothetical protein